MDGADLAVRRTRLRAGTAALVALLALLAALPAAAGLRQEAGSAAAGRAQVIAQGVAALPEGEVVWRTLRARAPLVAEADFAERPLGFLLATGGPILLTDQATGEQTLLGPGEAALVRPGAIQRRASLGERPAGYLAIELVPAGAPPPADATVLQPGQPFPAPSGWRDLDLLSAVLRGGETLVIPDTGAKNAILVTEGTVGVGRPGGAAATLLAGEAASFSGDLEASVAGDGGAPAPDATAAFVVAMIGPEVPPPPAAPSPTPAAATPEGTGSVTIEVFTCPAGMTPETLAVAVCGPAAGDFDVTLSGAALEAPLTLADAAAEGDVFVWSGLPFGDYLIAEAVLPAGYERYVLSAANAEGNAEAGYRVRLDAETPDLTVRIYNFAPE